MQEVAVEDVGKIRIRGGTRPERDYTKSDGVRGSVREMP
jgi:hypothetical protein